MRSALALLPSGRQLVGLTGSRVAFRVVYALLPLALFAAWSPGRYSSYALAMGAVVFVAPLVSCGPEKSALLLLPRARGRSQEILGAHLLLVAATAAVVLVVGLIVFGARGSGLSVLALLQAALLGVVQTLGAVLRALGHTGPETVSVGALAVGLLVGLGGVRVLGWGPQALLTWWAAYLVVVAAGLAWRLRAEKPRRPGAAVARRVLGRAARMSVGDVAAAAGLSLVYVALSLAGHREGQARLYTVMAVVSLGLNTLVYLTRLAQPEMSRRRLSSGWRRDGMPLGRYVLPTGALAVAAAAAASVHAASTPAEVGLAGLAVMLAAAVPLMSVVLLMHFAFENGDDQTLGVTARYAVVGFAATTLTAVVLVGPLGAIGAVDALVAGELTHGLLLWGAARAMRSTAAEAHGG